MIYLLNTKTTEEMTTLEGVWEKCLSKDEQRKARAGIENYKAFYANMFTPEKNMAQFEMSEHKFLHTLEVTETMLKCAPQGEEMLYFWTGLLHDFGRYHDIAKTSFAGLGHSTAGAEDLFHKGKIKMFQVDEAHYTSIENAVILHGVNNVEDECEKRGIVLSAKERKLVANIRLADKLSIHKFLLYMPSKITVQNASEEEIGISTMTDRTYCELINRTTVDRHAEVYLPNRHCMSHVGFIFDLDNLQADEALKNEYFGYLRDTDWVRTYFQKMKFFELAKTEELERLENVILCCNLYIEEMLKKCV